MQILIALAATLLPAAAQTYPSIRVLDAPDAIYLQVDRPGFASTYFFGIAPNGAVSGVSYAGQRAGTTPIPVYVAGQGFLLQGMRFTDIVYNNPATGSPALLTQALKINARGQVAGWSTFGPSVDGTEDGWIWERGQFRNVNYLGMEPSTLDPAIRYLRITDVMSVNSRADMIGQVAWVDPAKPDSPAGGWHAWLYHRGSFALIDPPDSLSPYPWDLNERGDIVGYYMAASAPFQRGFLRYADGTITELLVPADWNSPFATLPFGINSSGDIVGIHVDRPGHPRGFLLTGGVYTRIDVPGSLDTAPFAINEHGVIAGAFKGPDEVIHGFLRIPKQ